LKFNFYNDDNHQGGDNMVAVGQVWLAFGKRLSPDAKVSRGLIVKNGQRLFMPVKVIEHNVQTGDLLEEVNSPLYRARGGFPRRYWAYASRTNAEASGRNFTKTEKSRKG
jgi:hypothetical protein